MPRPLLLLLAAGLLTAASGHALRTGNGAPGRDAARPSCQSPCKACRSPASPNQGRPLLPQARAAIAADAQRWGA